MNGVIKTRMGKLNVEVEWTVDEADVQKLIERSVALALPAQLQAKAAGGRIADMDSLTEAGFMARFENRVQGETKVAFSDPKLEPWTPSTTALTPEKVSAAIKSGKLDLTPEQKAELAKLLST